MDIIQHVLFELNNNKKFQRSDNCPNYKVPKVNEKNGDVQTKSLRERIKIAAINGIIGAILGTIFFWNIGWLIGSLIFVVNVTSAITWEKNENIKTKSEVLIFLSPVIKGVIIGALAG